MVYDNYRLKARDVAETCTSVSTKNELSVIAGVQSFQFFYSDCILRLLGWVAWCALLCMSAIWRVEISHDRSWATALGHGYRWIESFLFVFATLMSWCRQYDQAALYALRFACGWDFKFAEALKNFKAVRKYSVLQNYSFMSSMLFEELI